MLSSGAESRMLGAATCGGGVERPALETSARPHNDVNNLASDDGQWNMVLCSATSSGGDIPLMARSQQSKSLIPSC